MHLAKNVATVLWDNSTDQWADLAERMMDFTRFRLVDIHCHSHNTWVETSDLTHTLRQLPDSIEWAVIFTSGNMVNHAGIVQQAVNYCVAHNAALCGHIIARHGFYHLHPQFFCLNLKIFKQFTGQLEPVSHNQPVKLDVVAVDCSPDNVHDDYTPWWIKPAGNQTCSIDVETDNFAQSFIAWLMNHGHCVINVPHEIRNEKRYSYVDYSHDHIRKFIADSDYTVDTEGGISHFLNYMRWTQDALKRGFYVLNSEPFRPVTEPEHSIAKFVGVCGGIKPAMIVYQPAFARNCGVVLFDISPMAIEWQRHLREHWNGRFENLQAVLDSFKQKYPDCLPSYFHHLGLMGTAEWFMKDTFTTDQVYTAWQHWLTLDVEYVHCNLLEEAAQTDILQRARSDHGSCYLWTSNLFNMDWMHFYHGRRWSQQANQQWLDMIQQCDFDIILEK